MFKDIEMHLIVWRKMNISKYFMMVLDTGYSLFVAMERSGFVIV